MTEKRVTNSTGLYSEGRGDFLSLFEEFEPYSEGQGKQLDPGASEVQFQLLQLPGLALKYFQTNKSLCFRGRIEAGKTSFTFCPNSRIEESSWCGSRVPKHAIPVLQPGTNHVFSLPAGWHDLELTIDNQLLEKSGLSVGSNEQTTPLCLMLDGDTLELIQTRLKSLLTYASTMPCGIIEAENAHWLTLMLLQEVQLVLGEAAPPQPGGHAFLPAGIQGRANR